MDANRGKAMYDWIMERLNEGLTVYSQTHLKTTKIRPKDKDCVRYHNGHCEVTRGNNWDSINYTKVSAG